MPVRQMIGRKMALAPTKRRLAMSKDVRWARKEKRAATNWIAVMAIIVTPAAMARFLFGFSGGSITSSHSNPRAWATLVSPWFFVVDGIYITCYITRHINWIAM